MMKLELVAPTKAYFKIILQVTDLSIGASKYIHIHNRYKNFKTREQMDVAG